MFKSKTEKLLSAELATAYRKNEEQAVTIVGLKRELEMARGQLHFWQEASRGHENKIANLMREQLSMLEAFRAATGSPPEFHDMIKRSQALFEEGVRDHVGVASLIMAVSLASSNQAEVIGNLIPSLKPMLDQLNAPVAARPQTQIASVRTEAKAIAAPKGRRGKSS